MNTEQAIREQLDSLKSDYEIDNHGFIRSPGSFEANHVSSLYFHDCVMSGGGDEVFYGEDDTQYDVFVLNPSEIKALGLGSKDYAAVYFTDTSGFVFCPVLTNESYLDFLQEIEN